MERPEQRSRGAVTQASTGTAVVIDTMVVSALINPDRRNPASSEYRGLIDGRMIVLSFVTVTELRYGALKAGWGELRRRGLERDFGRFTVVQPDDELMRICAMLRARCEQDGHGLGHRVRRKHAALQDVRVVVETKLAQMLARNPMRMDFYKKYQEIIADYNREKDRVTVEETFAKLLELARSLDVEQRRAAEEGLSDGELALFDLLFKEEISKADRERVKQASKSLLASLQELLLTMPDWTQNTSTQAEVKVFILDNLWQALPRPPFTDAETEEVASRVYEYVWQRGASHEPLAA